MTKTMSIRMDQDNFDFLNKLSKEGTGDVSKAARELINKGRLMLAVERYKKNQVSLGRAAELAGLTLGDMINTLAEYGVKSNLEKEDYLKGLENLRKVW
jgi:predicted HTH domain antitoxin